MIYSFTSAFTPWSFKWLLPAYLVELLGNRTPENTNFSTGFENLKIIELTVTFCQSNKIENSVTERSERKLNETFNCWTEKNQIRWGSISLTLFNFIQSFDNRTRSKLDARFVGLRTQLNINHSIEFDWFLVRLNSFRYAGIIPSLLLNGHFAFNVCAFYPSLVKDCRLLIESL